MALYFKTKVNKNGNIYTLWVDLDAKLLKAGYGCQHYTDTPYIIITKRKLDELKNEFKKHEYKEI